MTRGLRVALLGCLLSGVLILFGNGRDWATAAYPDRPRGVSGSSLAGSLVPWGLVALAGVVAIAATRRWGRVPVGVALAASGATVVALSVAAIREVELRVLEDAVVRRLPATPTAVDLTAWPYVAVAGGVLLALTGALVALRGPRWAGLSARYDAPAADAPRDDRDLWAAMDRGEDPTA